MVFGLGVALIRFDLAHCANCRAWVGLISLGVALIRFDLAHYAGGGSVIGFWPGRRLGGFRFSVFGFRRRAAGVLGDCTSYLGRKFFHGSAFILV